MFPMTNIDPLQNLLNLIDEHTDAIRDRDSFDSRDLISARDEAQEMLEDEIDEEVTAELRGIVDGVQGVEDATNDEFRHGISFIAEDYFEDYARELAREIGAVNEDATWPNNCIDWPHVANELQTDYTAIEINDETYYYR